MGGLEREIRKSFDVRTERFAHGGFTADLLLPRAADELIDTSDFNQDERLPYWAALWPSARALARHLLDGAPPKEPVLELGCGVALPSLALRTRGVEVLATDYYEEALLFARANAERNHLPPLTTALVDWRSPPPELGSFGMVLAADVLYERRNAEGLAATLPALVAHRGKVLLADPGRAYAGLFRDRMEEAGWRVAETGLYEEHSAGEASVQVRVLELRLPA